jgi:molecular chaperone HscC
VIERNAGALGEAGLEQARKAMARLKFHPRESLPNRTALARGDALFGQLVGEPRQLLGAHLGALRAAMETQDPREIEAARGRLLAQMDALRGPSRS